MPTVALTSHIAGVLITHRHQREECGSPAKECARWETRQSSICWACSENLSCFLKAIIALEMMMPKWSLDLRFSNAIIGTGFKGSGHPRMAIPMLYLPKVHKTVHQCCWQLAVITHHTCSSKGLTHWPCLGQTLIAHQAWTYQMHSAAILLCRTLVHGELCLYAGLNIER